MCLSSLKLRGPDAKNLSKKENQNNVLLFTHKAFNN